ncbi:hypothetical protein [Aquipuribacter sp. MA13-6]|uniref:hypothetical protein n=1 Tax=unclassified Aquipuribacter TaxID=2635084 RepID=UPI003EED173B
MRHLRRFLPHRDGTASPVDGSQGSPAPTLQHRTERRAVARRLHPDLGGDVEQYLAALAEVDRRHGPAPAGHPGPASRRSRRSGLRRRMNRAVRAARRRLPRHVPGARRYARL